MRATFVQTRNVARLWEVVESLHNASLGEPRLGLIYASGRPGQDPGGGYPGRPNRGRLRLRRPRLDTLTPCSRPS